MTLYLPAWLNVGCGEGSRFWEVYIGWALPSLNTVQ